MSIIYVCMYLLYFYINHWIVLYFALGESKCFGTKNPVLVALLPWGPQEKQINLKEHKEKKRKKLKQHLQYLLLLLRKCDCLIKDFVVGAKLSWISESQRNRFGFTACLQWQTHHFVEINIFIFCWITACHMSTVDSYLRSLSLFVSQMHLSYFFISLCNN